MKKTIAIILMILAVCVLLVACDNDNTNPTPEETTTNPSDETTTVPVDETTVPSDETTTDTATAEDTTTAHVHTEEVIPAVAATCTTVGKTEGKKCSVCGKVIVAQTEVAATGEHTPGSWVEVKNPTVDAEGVRQQLCMRCSYVCSEESIPMLVASVGLEFSSNGNGTCAVVGMGTCTDTKVVIPKHSPAGDLVTSIGKMAFDHCVSLVNVNIPSGVKSIGEKAFASCYSLTNITIPDGIRSIGEWVFAQCDSFTSVTIPDGVTSIGRYAFYSCDNLTDVIIPDSVRTINFAAFAQCPNLLTITFKGTSAQWGSINKATSWSYDSDNYYVEFSDGSTGSSGGTEWIDCSHCVGGMVTCSRCGGERTEEDAWGNDILCGGCGGSGSVYCDNCGGKGQVWE